MPSLIDSLRHAVITKAPLRVQTFFLGGGEEQEALALLSKKGGGRGLYRVSKSLTFFVLNPCLRVKCDMSLELSAQALHISTQKV